MANLVGQTLGQYRIVEPIGQGGMATVYKAYQPSLDRYVAVKVLPPYFAHEPGFAVRFTREARAVAGLNHPNILPIHDFGQEGNYSYIAMKYVEAGTLKEILGMPLALDLTADILRQVAAALDHAPVYRDWKLPAIFGRLRQQLEDRHGSARGARQFIRVLSAAADWSNTRWVGFNRPSSRRTTSSTLTGSSNASNASPNAAPTTKPPTWIGSTINAT